MIIIALPQSGFDPTECVAPWLTLTEAGYQVQFATPSGKPAVADDRMVSQGFGPLSPFLMTHPYILERYQQMLQTKSFKHPLRYQDIDVSQSEGLIIPGGHGKEMQDLLTSKELRQAILNFFLQNKPVGAICTGVLAVARTHNPQTGHSVLYGKKTTAVTKLMELTGLWVTYPWLKNYFKPNVDTVQEEIIQNLKDRTDFLVGPFPIFPMRYSTKYWNRQFVVKDGNYLSARWPGDAYRFSHEFLALVQKPHPLQ